MELSNLKDRYRGLNKDVYIIGTGPSLRFYKQDFFKDKITIGLNKAYELIKCTYNLTIHPELIRKDFYKIGQKWITKRKDWLTREFGEAINSNVYWFENNYDVKDYTNLACQGNRLYVGRGIATGGLCLAAYMAFRRAFLIGVDCCALAGDNHAIDAPTRFNGLPPEGVYREYFLNIINVRNKIYELYGIETYTLTPFVGPYWEEDYKVLCDFHKLEHFPPAKDESSYIRSSFDFQ